MDRPVEDGELVDTDAPFVERTSWSTPKRSRRSPRPTPTSTESLSSIDRLAAYAAKATTPNSTAPNPTDFVPMTLLFLKGLPAGPFKEMKQFFIDAGIDPGAIRDILRLSPDVTQIITFENKVTDIVARIRHHLPCVTQLHQFNPIDPSCYPSGHTFTHSDLQAAYNTLLQTSLTRIEGLILNGAPKFTRLANYISKIISANDIHYKPAPRPLRTVILGRPVALSPSSSTSMSNDVDV